MPVYEFKCPECGYVYERNNTEHFYCDGLSTPGKAQHKKRMVKRVWNIGGISFKGNGFYKNDNK